LTIAYAFIPASVVLIWFVAAFLSHKAMIRAGTGSQPIIRRLEWDLYNMVENLAITAGLPMPKVEIKRSTPTPAASARRMPPLR
jgi:heat shock protein HtpX